VPLAIPAAQQFIIGVFVVVVIGMGIAIFTVLRRGGRQ
jgi:hypothetical protein